MTKQVTDSYINLLCISAKTKREYKDNNNKFRSLQKQKSIETKELRHERINRINDIKKAYELEKSKFETMGYDLNYFLNQYNRIVQYNDMLRLAIKRGKVLKNTGEFSFPISLDTGKIHLKRLQKEIEKLNKSISEIQEIQYDNFYDNVKEAYGEEMMEIAKKELKDVPFKKVYDVFSNDIFLSKFLITDIEDFDAIDFYKYNIRFFDLIECCKS